MHLVVYFVFILSWVFFAIVISIAYQQEDDSQEWIVAITAFELGLLSQSMLMGSILYAIYWLHKTGEIIKRDRERIAEVRDREIDQQIAYIKDKVDFQDVDGGSAQQDEQDAELNEFLNVDRLSNSFLLILPTNAGKNGSKSKKDASAYGAENQSSRL